MNKDQLKSEIKFRTARSGGKGGQHVNKVETKVEATLHLEKSMALTASEKHRIREKLASQISADGLLSAMDQSTRSQLKNKEFATKKLLKLVLSAVEVKKKRRYRALKANANKRLEKKRQKADVKAGRRNPMKHL